DARRWTKDGDSYPSSLVTRSGPSSVLLPAPPAKGPAAVLRQDQLHIRVGAGDDVDRDQLAHALGRGRAGIGGGFPRTHVAAHHHGPQAAAHVFAADQRHVGGFDHGVGGFDRANQPLGFHHAQRNHGGIYGHIILLERNDG